MSNLVKLLISIAVAAPSVIVGFAVTSIPVALVVGSTKVNGIDEINGGARVGAVIVLGGFIFAAFVGYWVYKLLSKKKPLEKR